MLLLDVIATHSHSLPPPLPLPPLSLQKLGMFHLDEVDFVGGPAHGLTAIVTGSTSGIGMETAAALARRGATGGTGVEGPGARCKTGPEVGGGGRVKCREVGSGTRGGGGLSTGEVPARGLEGHGPLQHHTSLVPTMS